MSRAAAAISAAVEVARELGVPVDRPEVLADRSNLVIHLKPSPVVARVATMTAVIRGQPETWLQREVQVASYLAASHVPTVPPAPGIPPGPHRRMGFVMTFWAWRESAGLERVRGETAGRALAELHAAMVDYSGDLPLMGPILDDTARMLALLRRDGWPAPTLLEPAEAALERATALARIQRNPRPLHGDASLSNLFVSGDDLVWTDFEDACLGPAEWDLAVLVRSAGWEGPQVLRGYGRGITMAQLEPFIEARRLQAALWSAVLAPRSPDGRAQAEAGLRQLAEG